ncbi:phytoene desaturase family protein [Arcticibacterium luteifluviistationis]|uniref:All-trans-retinol 13,14-reductase n=1 Tax=Arcticibacterium luteifluviistationis TaxID=1784714 RepID=A0A2Z4GDG3_9BACT|nr:NAD(P)-binding protein [Arcticibacterium luteifluviistationis]AWV99157.1 all-trans-retinol 13,14-reductase [Arcticibacterium luteifluviistationis]
MAKFDYVIIGSGLGGLECAYILSKEGFSVCVLEKNRQLGGSLQIFVRDKAIFDTGVHYLGGLEAGQNLNQFFKYFEIMDKLNLHKMDENGFDRISFDNDPKEYKHAQGYENFVEQLAVDFPEERGAIELYAEKIREVCDYFPMYRLREANTDGGLGVKYLDVNAKDFIASITENKKLQMVLAGSNPLYAGDGEKTPLYVHALVVNTYIESSYKCIDGGSQIERHLTKNVKKLGGVVRNYAEVVEIVEKDGKVQYVLLADGEKVEGENFISNIHPANTMKMLVSNRIKKAYRGRVENLKNSSSAFVLDVVLKPGTFKYKNYNYYHFSREDVWHSVNVKGEMWPDSYCVFVPRSSKPTEYADSLTVLSYMKFEEVAQWQDTFSTIPHARESRGQGYEDFKKQRAEKLLDVIYKRIPELRNCVKSFTAGTPLTYRDYIGTDDGSLYGISKDYNEPLKTFISPTTKIPNLFFTGQNLNMHGILGVTVGAVRTCEAILGQDYLIKKINQC